MIQDILNKSFYYLFLITLIFGVITYGTLNFQLIDEICATILFVLFIFYMFNTKDWKINKLFTLILFIFIFYLAYSFYIKSNVSKAIIMDFIIQLKPYLAFFCVYQLKPQLNKKNKVFLNQLCLLCWFILIPLGIAGAINVKILLYTMGHPSNYASAITALALVYLYASKNTFKEQLVFIIMLTIGLASGRSKFYGLYIVALFVIFYFNNIKNLKFNIKTITLIGIMFIIIFFAVKEKLIFYFLHGISPDADMDYIARFVLYTTSITIFKEYIPFGSGFASFGTHASGAYYSPIYSKYKIDEAWGLSKNFNKFITDTYYPSLAQFGIVGLLLFALFWLYLAKKSYSFFLQTKDSRLASISLIIIAYFAIENVADAAFTSNRGFFFMMLLGWIFSDMKRSYFTTKMHKAAI
ncbi:MAG: O-antigen ligase domain-containing protein [Tannerellaceae bacterium]|nr:O-antigen ligase domain-containing protein [Tannerellaceae bacterium]